MHAGIGERAIDENAVAGIGHVGELGDVVATEQIVELMLPAGAGLGIERCVHSLLLTPRSTVAIRCHARESGHPVNTDHCPVHNCNAPLISGYWIARLRGR